MKAIKVTGFLNISKALLNDSIETFYKCLDDYQVDRRGDVGSWVREEAMNALTEFISNLFTPVPS